MYQLEKIVNLPSKLGIKQALSGKEILDAMVLIADEMEKDFENQDLSTIWHPFSGDYNEFMGQIVKKYKLNEKPFEGFPYRPYAGFPHQHHRPKKDFEYLSDILTFIDKQKFDSLDDNHELVGVTFLNWHHLHESSNYFSRNGIKGYFEEQGVPKFMSNLVSQAYAIKLRIGGQRSEEEVLMQIYNELWNKKINTKNPTINIMKRDQNEHVFEYNNRVIVVDEQKRRNNNEKNKDYGFLNLVFAAAIYYGNKEEKKDEVLGYVILNNSEKIHKFFGIEKENNLIRI